jgi:hypothetical protein
MVADRNGKKSPFLRLQPDKLEGNWAKKEPPLPAAQSDNREASNRVDRSHSVSKKMDADSNEGESLTSR